MISKIFHNRLRILRKIWLTYLNLRPLPQADLWLKTELKKYKNAGKQDRSFYRDTFFLLLRQAPSFLNSSDPKNNQIQNNELWYQKFLTADFNQLVAFCMRQNSSSFADIAAPFQDPMNVTILNFYAIPFIWREKLLNRVQKSNWSKNILVKFLKSLLTIPPIWLRMDSLQSKNLFLAAAKNLPIEFIETENKQIHELSLPIKTKINLYTLPLYQSGHFTIQDAGSQSIGLACHPQNGDIIWDRCAGGGGKTLQLANLLQGTGSVIATDIRDYKLNDLKKRAALGKYCQIHTQPWKNKFTIDDFPENVKKNNGFDIILIDAPCSGSGTWRRRPDAKWRPINFNELFDVQSELLDSSVAMLNPHGKIVYATCSFFYEENESQIAHFVQRHPHFKLIHQRLVLPFEIDSDSVYYAILKMKQ